MEKVEGASERQMLDEIAILGYPRPTVNFLHYGEGPLPDDVVNVILKWLPNIYKDHIGTGEHLIRALINTQTPFDPAIIVHLFENSSYNSTLKSTMAYVLSVAKVKHISHFIRDQLFNKPVNFERAGFLFVIDTNARFQNNLEIIDCLKRIFDNYCSYEQWHLLFRKYGSKMDIEFLEEKSDNKEKKCQQEIKKTIKKLLGRRSA